MQYDVWAVTPDSDDNYFFGSATISTSGAISLLANNIGVNGTGYKVSITSNGNDSGVTFGITGVKVGAVGYDGIVTEAVTGPNNTTVYSANYYTSIRSITTTAGSTGGVKIGYGGDLAFPRTRIKGVYFVTNGSTGSVTFIAKPTNTTLLKLVTPSGVVSQDMIIPGEGILTTKSGGQDFAILATSSVISVTVICG